MQSYKELVIWQKSKQLALIVYAVTKHFPPSETYGLTSQMNRSAISVPSNIAEGWSRQSTKEFINFLYIARGSLSELETQSEICRELRLISAEDSAAMESLTEELRKMLIVMIKKLKNNITPLTANR